MPFRGRGGRLMANVMKNNHVFLEHYIELFLFSTAVKGYVYFLIYISILASAFMSTDTLEHFPYRDHLHMIVLPLTD